jgi:HEPN domain-containing protein
MTINDKHSKEWMEQAEYDLGSGKAMLDAGRNIYCVFMCHLSIEKALKALYLEVSGKNPPKVHSLVYFAQSIKLDLSEEYRDFIEKLDEVSVPVRYPEELSKMLKDYDRTRTKNIYLKSKEILEWLKAKLKKR